MNDDAVPQSDVPLYSTVTKQTSSHTSRKAPPRDHPPPQPPPPQPPPPQQTAQIPTYMYAPVEHCQETFNFKMHHDGHTGIHVPQYMYEEHSHEKVDFRHGQAKETIFLMINRAAMQATQLLQTPIKDLGVMFTLLQSHLHVHVIAHLSLQLTKRHQTMYPQ